MDSNDRYKLKPGCSAANATSLAINNAAAFWGQAWWRLTWEGRSLLDMTSAMELRVPRNLHTQVNVCRHEKVTNREGEVVGYARWILSESLAHEWLATKTEPVSDDDLAAFQESYERADWKATIDTSALDPLVDAAMEKYRPKGPHIKLDYLAVHPAHQRCGVAFKLLKSGLEQAGRLRVKCFVMAKTKDSLQLYTKYGFECLDGFSQKLEPWGLTETFDTYFLVKHSAEKGEDQSTTEQSSLEL